MPFSEMMTPEHWFSLSCTLLNQSMLEVTAVTVTMWRLSSFPYSYSAAYSWL